MGLHPLHISNASAEGKRWQHQKILQPDWWIFGPDFITKLPKTSASLQDVFWNTTVLMWWLVAYAIQGIVKLSVFACRSKFGNTVDQKAASIFYSTDSSRRDNCCFSGLKSDFLSVNHEHCIPVENRECLTVVRVSMRHECSTRLIDRPVACC